MTLLGALTTYETTTSLTQFRRLLPPMQLYGWRDRSYRGVGFVRDKDRGGGHGVGGKKGEAVELL